MAKIVIAGDAVVVTSSLKLEDIRKVEKYNPKALYLMGGEDGKEPIFRVGTAKKGTIGEYGVEFASETHDENKLASITIANPYTGPDIKEAVAEAYGPIIMNLNKVEAAIPDVLAAIEADKAAVLENIQVAQ